ncbi:hypothetical protein [uncultured Bacteroides sp.]|nr:hypothetical protein [uncultured Bacteroides sp.]
MLYHVQIKNMNILSENLSLTTPIAADRYNQALKSAIRPRS